MRRCSAISGALRSSPIHSEIGSRAREAADPGQGEIERRRGDLRQPFVDVFQAMFRHLADEAQRDMEIVGIDPVGAGQAGLQRRQALAQIFRQVDGDEKTDHADGLA
jgi:hypothetical protein